MTGLSGLTQPAGVEAHVAGPALPFRLEVQQTAGQLWQSSKSVPDHRQPGPATARQAGHVVHRPRSIHSAVWSCQNPLERRPMSASTAPQRQRTRPLKSCLPGKGLADRQRSRSLTRFGKAAVGDGGEQLPVSSGKPNQPPENKQSQRAGAKAQSC